MPGIWRNWWRTPRFPVEVREQLDNENVIVRADRVAVVRHFSGRVPGVVSSGSVTRLVGAFAVTTTRVVASLPMLNEPKLLSVDSPWGLERGPGRITIGPKGLSLAIDLPAVDADFSGSMTLNYKHTITDDLLAALPSTELVCAIDPLLVYRAAGVRPRT